MEFKPPTSFNPGDNAAESWRLYKQQYDFFLEAADLTGASEKRKVAMLLHCMGVEYQKIYGTIAWDADGDKDKFDKVIEKLDSYFQPRKHIGTLMGKFNTRIQKPGESLQSYITDLKSLGSQCELGDLTDKLVAHRISAGVRDESLKEKLMGKDDLTLDKAIDICMRHEYKAEQRKVFATPPQSQDVNYVQKRGSRSRGRGRGNPNQRTNTSGPECDNCGLRHALGKSHCPAAEKNCDFCGIKGHFFKKCRKRHAQSQTGRGRGYGYRRGYGRGRYRGRGYGSHRNVHHLAAGEEPEQTDDELAQEFADAMYISHITTDEPEYALEPEYDYTGDMTDTLYIANITSGPGKSSWNTKLNTRGMLVPYMVDTGAMCSVISQATLSQIPGPKPHIRPSYTNLRAFGGQKLHPVGSVELPVKFKSTEKKVKFEVLPNVQNLIGGQDSEELGLVRRVFNVNQSQNSTQSHSSSASPKSQTQTQSHKSQTQTQPKQPQAHDQSQLKYLIDKYKDVFEGLGSVEQKYDIVLKPDAEPTVQPARPIPVALRPRVKEELDKMEMAGIIEKVPPGEPADWVSNMVVVSKPNKIRICINPKMLNKAIKREHHPLRTVEDVATRLNGSRYFTVLDCNQGFFQLRLTEQSSKLLVMNTPFGRYRYLRMPMGVACAPEIYQRAMEDMFGDLDGVEIIMDDLLIHALELMEMARRLEAVLLRARELNIKFTLRKLKLALPEVDYVGHVFSGEGIKPAKDKVAAIAHMPLPKDHEELSRALGVVTYLSKFIPNLSTMVKPLREVLQSQDWYFDEPQKRAWKQMVSTLTSQPVLRFYSTTEPVEITCDASKSGLGAMMSQGGQPVAYASRALSDAETRYAQIEKEMLAITFACGKFHKLIYGRPDVTIYTDHKPLESIYMKDICKAPMRLQKMLLKVQPYPFKLVFRPGKEIPVADALSRAYLPHASPSLMDDEMMICSISEVIPFSPQKYQLLCEETHKDPVLQRLIQMIQEGWPDEKRSVPNEIRSFWDVRDELSVYQNIVFRGERVVVPQTMQSEMLSIIHAAHQGMVKSKQRANDVLFWPGMNKQIEEVVSKCANCLAARNKQQKEPLKPSNVPSLPWAKVAADLFELFGETFLVNVDYYSEFFELAKLLSTTSESVIESLKEIMSRHGIPSELVSDCGPQFVSKAFKKFAEEYGFVHRLTSPTHAQSNGMAEKAVQTAKKIITRAKETGQDPYLALLDWRNTPRDREIGSPAQRLMGRRTRTRLPTAPALLYPKTIDPVMVKAKLQAYRDQQKGFYDKSAKPLPFLAPGDTVRMRSNTENSWKPARVVDYADTEGRSYYVENPNGRLYRRNRVHLMKTPEFFHSHIQPNAAQQVKARPVVVNPPQSAPLVQPPIVPVTPPRRAPPPPVMPVTPPRPPSQMVTSASPPPRMTPTSQVPVVPVATPGTPMKHSVTVPSPGTPVLPTRTMSGRQVRMPTRLKDYVMK